MDVTRLSLAIITGVLTSAGGWLWLSGDTVNGGIALRVALVCAGTWLAWPVLSTRSLTRLAVLAGSVLVVILRPRAALVVVPALLLWAAMRPGGRADRAGTARRR